MLAVIARAAAISRAANAAPPRLLPLTKNSSFFNGGNAADTENFIIEVVNNYYFYANPFNVPMTFGEKIIQFNNSLHFNGKLPEGIRIMNPFRESAQANAIAEAFYRKFYNDNNERRIILGINPGRFGAGVTGVPFTDTKRLLEYHGVALKGAKTHEPSAVFIYEMMLAYGGLEKFYSRFYFSSVCPLGFTTLQPKGEINYNYYDSKELTASVYDFIVSSLEKQLAFGIDRSVGFCLGTGDNAKFLIALNKKCNFFKTIRPLEHPRFVMQYKTRTKQDYIEKYIRLLDLL